MFLMQVYNKTGAVRNDMPLLYMLMEDNSVPEGRIPNTKN